MLMSATEALVPRAVCLPALFLLLVATSARAQTSVESPLQFEFVNPGAKSLALGGAFAGIADDATAAFANPAGLTLLGMPEVSFEFRRSLTTTLALKGGRLSGPVSGIGIDTRQGPDFDETDTPHYGIRYLAAVYPGKSHRWVFAGYRHEFARVHQRLDSEGIIQQDPSEPQSRRELPYEVERDLSITGYGVSAAYKVTRDLALGVSGTLYTFDLDSVFRTFAYEPPYGLGEHEADSDTLRLLEEGQNVSVAPTFGAVYDRGRARLGVVYRHGASFGFEAEETDGANWREGTFRLPHSLAFGASVRVTPALMLSGEITRITYSRLVDDFVTDQALASGQQASFSIDDGTEYHGSVQYAWRRQGGSPIRLRGGIWYDPDHSVHYTPSRAPVTAEDRLFDERFSAALSTGRSFTHLTGGVGFTIARQYELNAGLDWADRSRQFSTSLIVHLGREVQ